MNFKFKRNNYQLKLTGLVIYLENAINKQTILITNKRYIIDLLLLCFKLRNIEK